MTQLTMNFSFASLRNMEPPPTFVAAVKRIYTDNIVVLKIEKEVREIPQEVGVQQGNNMAPVLFLFLMTAFAKTLEMEWKRENIKVVTVMTASDDLIQHGQLCSHTP
jgi:hypothetical protein